jgi:hypothetical protein
MIITEETLGSEYLVVVKDGKPLPCVAEIDTEKKTYLSIPFAFDLPTERGTYDHLVVDGRVLDDSEDVKEAMLAKKLSDDRWRSGLV